FPSFLTGFLDGFAALANLSRIPVVSDGFPRRVREDRVGARFGVGGWRLLVRAEGSCGTCFADLDVVGAVRSKTGGHTFSVGAGGERRVDVGQLRVGRRVSCQGVSQLASRRLLTRLRCGRGIEGEPDDAPSLVAAAQ